ncbi:hypothetical protein CKO28_20895 [Rhodovibrio sodomensis]|uniref:FAD-binding oxidoreductase n=1 Tax=Rhodovibrio sodomensis TaxID=1088 RepID=A0ABS1DJ15_9PROT|nr:pyridoxamine 5'-phosphate oxidase family protein [Rhodovibrio sodomensis]MBK1670486.1 hypothetical protein [Rhodovibrio sodomensis]
MTGSSGSPFHQGERWVQARVGVREDTEHVGQSLVRPQMTAEHQAFFENLPFVAVGSVDPDARVWASVMVGRPGFIDAHDPTRLTIQTPARQDDPFFAGLKTGHPIGLLGIDLETRRRNRVNGQVTHWSETLEIAVTQAYGNCPKYIQRRQPEFGQDPEHAQPTGRLGLDRLDHSARDWIRTADTFFIASVGPGTDAGATSSADVSHRGGRPGFVRIEDDRHLLVPDYAGNNFFNTLGNLVEDPRAGITFVDFESGDLLQLTGDVEIIWDGPEVRAFKGAQRAWRLRIEGGVRLSQAVPLRSTYLDAAPTTLATGTWSEAAPYLADARARAAWRTYQITDVADESETVRSFYLRPADGGQLPPFLAGQHLPVRVAPGQGAQRVIRRYTISTAPADNRMRISVKRDPSGHGSKTLHDHYEPGDSLDAQAPNGRFTLDTETGRPLVLVSAGIGATPMVSMLRQVVADGLAGRGRRQVWFFHGDRTSKVRPFHAEVKALEEAVDWVRTHFRLSRPGPYDRRGRDYDAPGHLTVESVKTLLPPSPFDVYLCGPRSFMQAFYDGLREIDVPDKRIFTESFGAHDIHRRPDGDDMDRGEAQQARVVFQRSDKQVDWRPESGSLLDLAEAAGVALPADCRRGECSTCATRLIDGEVHYRRRPTAAVGPDEVLTCSAVPRARDCGTLPQVTLDV